jgi:putative hydrolases of HD superfamily
MKDNLPAVVAFLTDLERLKLASRKAYISDPSRRENSAEHSWHLALGLLTIAHELNMPLDLHKALVMALIHDTCEAGPIDAIHRQPCDSRPELEGAIYQSLAGTSGQSAGARSCARNI